MATSVVMTEKEEKIMQTFGKVIPKLTENQKNYLLGLGEGMSIAQAEAERKSDVSEAVQGEREALPW